MDINILNYLDTESIALDLKQKNKKNIISFLLDYLIKHNKIKKEHKREILKTVLQREEMGSTAIGGGVAFPHARTDVVKNIIICFGISSEGVNFDSLDQEPVYILALLLSHQKEAGLHLKILAFLARILKDKYFIQQIRQAKNKEEILPLIEKQQRAVR